MRYILTDERHVGPMGCMGTAVSACGERPLTPPQREVLDSGLLHSGFNCVLQMPTGSGKTWLAERAIAAVLGSGGRAIYLTPLRALAAELGSRWSVTFGPSTVGIFTGDYGAGKPYLVTFHDARLLVMTPERLDACTRAWRAHWSWIPEVDLLVADEFHLLGDPHRGARLEGALSRFTRLNPFTRLLALSATLGNRPQLASWLDGIEFASPWRPISIRWRVVRYRRAVDKPELLAQEVVQTARAGGKSLVFVQSRRRAEELGRLLQTHDVRARHHHAGLPHADRKRVEAGFRGEEIDVLVATSTLEMGVNLPVRQVVLYDLQTFDGSEFRALSTSSVWQRAGRAGRPGLDEEGEAVLFAPVWDRDVDRYARAHFEPIVSGLSDPRALAEQIVTEVASGLARTPGQLRALFGRSLAAFQEKLPRVDAVVTDMLEAGMLREEHEDDTRARLQATRLGRIAVRHLLSPATVLGFQRALAETVDFSFLDLLLIAASSADCEPIFTVDFEELEALASHLAGERSHLLQRSGTQLAELLGIGGKRLLSALKLALVARAWTRVGDASEVAEQHDCYPFEVERLRESLDRLLLAMSAVLDVRDADYCGARSEEPNVLDRVRALHHMIVAGLDESVATLTLVRGIGARQARRLQTAGISDIEELALAEPASLVLAGRLSLTRAQRWIEEGIDIVRTRSAFTYRESGPLVPVAPRGWPSDIDPYRLRRALDLAVSRKDAASYVVSGGLEPHTVQVELGRLRCDCRDAERGVHCKHAMAVRLSRGDRPLRRLANKLRGPSVSGGLDLFALWYGDRPTARRFP